MASNACPDCGKPLFVIQQNHIKIEKCSCGYQKNLNTGEVVRIDNNIPFCVIKCQHCGGKNKIFHSELKKKLTCVFCKEAMIFPAKKESLLTVNVRCPRCSSPNPTYANQGNVTIYCNHCSANYVYNSGTWPTAGNNSSNTVNRQPQTAFMNPSPKPQPQKQPTYKSQQPQPQPQKQPTYKSQQPQPQPQKQPTYKPQNTKPVQSYTPKTPTRAIEIRRFYHAHNDFDMIGMQNIIKDSLPVKIYLDGALQGTLPKNETMVLHLDSSEHHISTSTSPLGSDYKLPAGNDSYYAGFFNGGFSIGIVGDPFTTDLVDFLLKMVRGQGFRDRIMNPNNQGNKVEIHIHHDCIRITYALKETKGVFQWLTGENEEKIYYSQIGLTPTAKNSQPSGYWAAVEEAVRSAIISDKKADLEHVAGGYTFRTTHSLY